MINFIFKAMLYCLAIWIMISPIIFILRFIFRDKWESYFLKKPRFMEYFLIAVGFGSFFSILFVIYEGLGFFYHFIPKDVIEAFSLSDAETGTIISRSTIAGGAAFFLVFVFAEYEKFRRKYRELRISREIFRRKSELMLFDNKILNKNRDHIVNSIKEFQERAIRGESSNHFYEEIQILKGLLDQIDGVADGKEEPGRGIISFR